MANVAIPGFFPSHLIGIGGGATVTYRRYRVLTNNTNAINCYDAVKRSSHDIISLGESSTHTTAIDSVAVGASYIDSTGARRPAKNLPATTLYTSTGNDPVNASYVFLVDNPTNVAFEATSDTTPVLADLNLNVSINLAAGVNGYSAQTLAYAAKATTATLPIRMRDFVFRSDLNIDSGANAHLIVTVNAGQDEPALSASTGA